MLGGVERVVLFPSETASLAEYRPFCAYVYVGVRLGGTLVVAEGPGENPSSRLSRDGPPSHARLRLTVGRREAQDWLLRHDVDRETPHAQ